MCLDHATKAKRPDQLIDIYLVLIVKVYRSVNLKIVDQIRFEFMVNLTHDKGSYIVTH